MAKLNFILEDRAIKFSVLKKLPPKCTFLALVRTKDMDNKDRDAILVMWRDSEIGDLRKANFCLETGEYLGEEFLNLPVHA